MLCNPVISFFSTPLSFLRVSECQTSSTPIVMYMQKLLITIQNNLSCNPLSGCTEILVLQFFSLLINLVIPFLSTWHIDCCSLTFVIDGLQMVHCNYIVKVNAQRAHFSIFDFQTSEHVLQFCGCRNRSNLSPSWQALFT